MSWRFVYASFNFFLVGVIETTFLTQSGPKLQSVYGHKISDEFNNERNSAQ